MPVSEQTYRQLALEDPEGKWELHCGTLRSKPVMTLEHNDMIAELGYRLRHQLRRAEFRVRFDTTQVRRSATQYYIPDIIVIPSTVERRHRGRPDELEAYAEPLPLIVEVWSRSTGGYDVRDKLPDYQRRGDVEIWLVHPYDRLVTAWRRQPDGTYIETVFHGGIIRPIALPGVAVDLDELVAND